MERGVHTFSDNLFFSGHLGGFMKGVCMCVFEFELAVVVGFDDPVER